MNFLPDLWSVEDMETTQVMYTPAFGQRLRDSLWLLHAWVFPLLHAAVSSAYQKIKLKGYNLLEERNRELVRKLNPCLKQYKRYEQYYHNIILAVRMPWLLCQEQCRILYYTNHAFLISCHCTCRCDNYAHHCHTVFLVPQWDDSPHL